MALCAREMTGVDVIPTSPEMSLYPPPPPMFGSCNGTDGPRDAVHSGLEACGSSASKAYTVSCMVAT